MVKLRNVGKHGAVRWVAPVAVAGLAIGVPLAASQASAEPPLPPLTAQQLLADLGSLKAQPLSGEVRQTVDLGIPQLSGVVSPTIKDLSVGSLVSLATGTHTWRVWTDAAQAERVALVQGTGESDVIRNGSDVWVWSSADSSAVHSTLSTGTKTSTAEPTTRTPQDVADAILTAVDPTTTVTTSRADTVAGRPVYELVLTPKQADTKVGSVRLAIDAETKVPLRVQVLTHDGTDAIDVAFTSVEFATPDAALFRFTPPAGTTVTEQSASGSAADKGATPTGNASTTTPTEKVVGTGWTSVLVASSPVNVSTAAKGSTDATLGQLLGSLPVVSGSWGSGHLLEGALESVLLTDDGRVAAGAVTPDALYAALGK